MMVNVENDEPISLWSMRCAGRLADQCPELHEALRRGLLCGRVEGHGSAPRRAALQRAGAALPALRRPAKKRG